MSLLIRNARILCFDAADTEHARADILVRGTRIEAVGPDLDIGAAAPDRIIDAAGQLAIPGLINAHFHSPGNLMKGMLDDLPLEIFMLYEVPPLRAGLPVKRLNYVRTLLGAMEMVRLGITSVMDDAFHIPVASIDGIDGIMEAYRDIGMRARVAIDQPNIVEYEKYPYLADLLPPDMKRAMEQAPLQSGPELLELYAHLIGRWDGTSDGRIGAALSCSAPHRVTPDYLQGLTELGRRHDLPFNVHILETKLQRVLGDEKFGRSLVRMIDDGGHLDERSIVIHAIWIDERDTAILAERGVTVAHNPVCNLRLGSGIMGFRALRDAGIPICLGTDEAAVDDSVNLWFVTKMAGLIHTLADPDYRTWPTAPEVLSTMYSGGARAMRQRRPIGVIEPGAEADIVLLDLDTLAFTPLNDLRRQLVYCENGSSVLTTIIAGRVVYEDGRLTQIDEQAIKAEIRELSGGAYGAMAADLKAEAQALEPYYRAMYLKAHGRG